MMVRPKSVKSGRSKVGERNKRGGRRERSERSEKRKKTGAWKGRWLGRKGSKERGAGRRVGKGRVE